MTIEEATRALRKARRRAVATPTTENNRAVWAATVAYDAALKSGVHDKPAPLVGGVKRRSARSKKTTPKYLLNYYGPVRGNSPDALPTHFESVRRYH